MINNNLKSKQYKKCKALAYILSIIMMASPLVACSEIDPAFYTSSSENKLPSSDSSSVNAEANANQQTHQQIKSLEQINPTYSYINWRGKQQLCIDEESLKQIITLALNDAVDFYQNELGAPTLTFSVAKDSNGSFKLVNTTGANAKFLEDEMNWAYYLGRAKIESSNHYMVDFINYDAKTEEKPAGVFQLQNESISGTLEWYFSTYFNYNTDLSDMNVIANEYDIANALTSKKSADNVTKSVYNSALKTIMHDIYKLKSMTKGHASYYSSYSNTSPEEIISKYNIDESLHDEVYQICKELDAYNGIYSPTLALSALNATHFYGFDNVVSSLNNGSFFKNYFNSDYVKKTMESQDELENNQMQ